jgi:hypothetical protein
LRQPSADENLVHIDLVHPIADTGDIVGRHLGDLTDAGVGDGEIGKLAAAHKEYQHRRHRIGEFHIRHRATVAQQVFEECDGEGGSGLHVLQTFGGSTTPA